MSDASKKAAREIFKKLHSPERPVFQIGHARRSNNSEDYNSALILDTGARLLEPSVQVAHGIIARFAENAQKPVLRKAAKRRPKLAK